MNFMSTLARFAGVLLFFSVGFTSLLRAAMLRSAFPVSCSCWYFSKAEKALLANSAMGANVSRFLLDERSNGFKRKVLQSFLHLAPDAGVIDLKISKIGPDFSFRFLLMSRMTERVTKMIMTPRANLGFHILDDFVDETVRE